ncbi:right-handed parallel beta-helix repeat-containing protein [Hydrogenophaga sp. A37]|uniref:right-handed parallel beta-helix repeat-containing protein n=1 Tax=Hydrogenophaga sp. A37 TaxID=1945864 RepID=UPI001C0C0D4C|nr:right-handed parallel beta-helix repeat-containing protein [Hydrogenophaga sp. A37]
MTRTTLLNRIFQTVLALTIYSLMGVSLVHAQATRTWVSGVGDDANPCSRTAPCKTFAGAISKTAVNGEISVLDPGGFGAVTITKSITINGDGTLAGILTNAGNGISVNASGAAVTVRNLSIVGSGTGAVGIRLLDGAALIVDRVSISGFATAGIETAIGTTGNVMVLNSTIVRNGGIGVHAGGGSIAVENSILANNGVGAQAGTGATVRLTNNGVYNNLTGFGCGGGVLASNGDNRKANNVGGGIPACSPTVAIAVQ